MIWNRVSQSLQQFMLVLGLGLLLSQGWMIGQPAVAASTPALNASPGLEASIDAFLQNIPRGFYGVQDVAKIQAKVAEGKTLFIDVREPSEYGNGHIPGAIDIPLRELAQHLDQVPHDQPVMLYCSTGYRTGLGVMAFSSPQPHRPPVQWRGRVHSRLGTGAVALNPAPQCTTLYLSALGFAGRVWVDRPE